MAIAAEQLEAHAFLLLGPREVVLASVADAVVVRERRWRAAVAPLDCRRAPEAGELRRLLRAATQDPIAAVRAAFGPPAPARVFALAGPPGIIAGTGAGSRFPGAVGVRCDPRSGVAAVRSLREPGPARGWLVLQPGMAVAWGPEGPEVVVDLGTGAERILPPGGGQGSNL